MQKYISIHIYSIVHVKNNVHIVLEMLDENVT